EGGGRRLSVVFIARFSASRDRCGAKPCGVPGFFMRCSCRSAKSVTIPPFGRRRLSRCDDASATTRQIMSSTLPDSKRSTDLLFRYLRRGGGGRRSRQTCVTGDLHYGYHWHHRQFCRPWISVLAAVHAFSPCTSDLHRFHSGLRCLPQRFGRDRR